MIALKRSGDTPDFVPDYTAKSLADIDFELLKRRGIRYIAFDADSTLVSFRGRTMERATRLLLSSKRPMFKAWCIASNRITNDMQGLAQSIDASVVHATLFTRKPSQRFFNRVFQELGAKPEEVAMIGDKLIADMWGGRRAGMTTVWVERIGNDNPFDRLFRVRRKEKKLMKAYTPLDTVK